jgi:DNA-binding IscR family transcriptional regulator
VHRALVGSDLGLLDCRRKLRPGRLRLRSDCAKPHDCSIRWLMQKVRDATAGVLDDCTLADALGKRPMAHTALDLGKGTSKIRAG